MKDIHAKLFLSKFAAEPVSWSKFHSAGQFSTD